MRYLARTRIVVLICLGVACGEPAPTWRGLPIPPEAEQVAPGAKLPTIDTLQFVVARGPRYDGIHDYYEANLGRDWESCPVNRPWWVSMTRGRGMAERRKSTWIDVEAQRRLLLVTEYVGSRRGMTGNELQQVKLSDTTFADGESWRVWLRRYCHYKESDPAARSRGDTGSR